MTTGTASVSAAGWITGPADPAVPVVACLPHGGRTYPDELTSALAVRPEVLWSDWLTRELYEFLPELGITMVATGYSRFVADVNRDPGGEQHGGFWTSAVAARMPNGRAIYSRPLTPGEIGHRIRLAHEPFHLAIEQAIRGLLASFPRVLLLDLHSFGTGLDGDVILGDRHGTTASPAAAGMVAGALGQPAWTCGATSGSPADGRSAGSPAMTAWTRSRSSSTSVATWTWPDAGTRSRRRQATSAAPSGCCGTRSPGSLPRPRPSAGPCPLSSALTWRNPV